MKFSPSVMVNVLTKLFGVQLRWGLLFLAIAAAPATPALACQSTTPQVAGMKTAVLHLATPKGDITVPVRVADEPAEWRAGFQHICPTTMRQQQIWFSFPYQARGKFHMNNVHAPIDIGFFSADGKLLEVFKMKTYRGDSRPVYGPSGPYQYALEAHAGYFRTHHIVPGTRIIKLEP